MATKKTTAKKTTTKKTTAKKKPLAPGLALLSAIDTAQRDNKTVFYTPDGDVHNRDETLGASEAWGCLRKSAFEKNPKYSRDPGFVDTWGFGERGHNVEAWFVEKVRASLGNHQEFLYAGTDQSTLRDGLLSATPDGLLVDHSEKPKREDVIEVKSIDPRANVIEGPRPAHAVQAQVQMHLIRRTTKHRPKRAIIYYINASDYANVITHLVEFNPKIAANAVKRAALVFSSEPGDLMAEGSWTDECQFCAFAQQCSDAIIKTFPKGEKPLPKPAERKMARLLLRRKAIREGFDEAEVELKKTNAEIKALLTDVGIKKTTVAGWGVSYSWIKGRETLDEERLAADGIDLAPYKKSGGGYERLDIKPTKK
jgi:hypothetical protein